MEKNNKLKSNLRIGEMLAKSWHILWKNIVALIAIMASFMLVPGIILGIVIVFMSTFILVGVYSNTLSSTAVALISILSIVLSIFISIFATMGTIGATKLIHERKNNPKYHGGEAIKFAFSKFKQSLGYTFLMMALVIVFGLILFLAIFLTVRISGILAIILAIVVIIAMYAIMIYMVFTIQTITIKNLSVMDSFKYSISLVKGRFANVFGKMLILAIINLCISAIMDYLVAGKSTIIIILSVVVAWLVAVYSVIAQVLMFEDYDEIDGDSNFTITSEIEIKYESEDNDNDDMK